MDKTVLLWIFLTLIPTALGCFGVTTSWAPFSSECCQVVLFNYSPLVPRRGNTSFICADLSGESSRSQLFIKRLFKWNGKTSTRGSVQSVLNFTGLEYSWNVNPTTAVGAYGCGKGKKRVTSYKMNELGLLRPEAFTQTVAAGTRVLIRMFPARSSDIESLKRVSWWKDGRKLRMTRGRIWQVESGGRVLVIQNATHHDAGVYMAHRLDESVFFAAATIIKVRDCPLNKWSGNCSRPCLVCKNGGSCDVESGKCLCPPGFSGKHCERACPSRHFGVDCSVTCDSLTSDGTCQSLQMCQVSGCQCMSGWTGPDCKQPCPPNQYGAGCTEQCHCKNGVCNRFRGCICSPGWFGPHCKSTVSSQNTLSHQDDQPARLRVRERPPQIVEIRAIPSFKVNPGQRVEVHCSVTGFPLPISGEILLKRGEHNETTPNRTIQFSNRTTAVFSLGVVSFYPGPYSCVSTTRAGSTRKAFNFTLAELPRPISAPVLIRQASTQLVIGLNSRRFSGDGPIIRTVVMFKKREDESYIFPDRSIIYNDSITIGGLDEYTTYNFRVLLYREGGESGRGIPGPVADITTKCGLPTASPIIKQTYPINNSTVFLTWAIPPRDTLKGDIKGYTIRYYPLGKSNRRQVLEIPRSNILSTTIKDLVPNEVYGMQVKLENCGGESPWSSEVRVTMGHLAKPRGPKLVSSNLTSTSVSFTWTTPTNARPYTIVTYEINFVEVNNPSANAMRMRTNTTKLSRDFTELVPHTSYAFRVKAFNHEGPGNDSDVITVTTHEDVPSQPINLRVSMVTTKSLLLIWDPPQHPNGVLRTYKIEMRREDKDWMRINNQHPGNKTNIQIMGLKNYTSYQFRVRGFTVGNGPWSDVITTRTRSDRPLLPPQIIDVDVINSQSVVIRWAPPVYSPYVDNMTSYKVIYTDDLRQTHEHWRSKVVDGSELSMLIEELRVDTVYAFKIAAKTLHWGPYSVQTTRRTNKLGLPPAPYDVKISNVTSSTAIVTWHVRSAFHITNVKIRFLSSGSSPLPQPILEEKNSVFKKLTGLTPDTQYEVEIMAGNYVGFSSSNPVLRFKTEASAEVEIPDLIIPNPDKQTRIYQIISAVAGGIVLIIIILFVFIHCRGRQGAQRPCPNQLELDSVSTNNRLSTFGSSSQGGGINSRSGTMLSIHSKHSTNSRCPSTYSGQIFPESLILPWENILFEDIPLGVGNFGQVVKAVVQKDGKIIQTAVKMLKDGSTLDDKRDFLAELDTMVRIGHHKNVVSLVGACEHDYAMYLCTEFAPNGNLLQFLRKSRKADDSDGSYTTLSQTQLLQFASDVSQGMSYLSEKQLIHRDLAARNILLGEHLICKVADFGLSRGEGVYVKKTVSRLPIRWMAIESLNYNVYTSKSDVWSFGVLLWEIVSLGGTPYCGMSCAELYEKLPTGYRMEKPINCDDEVYALMYQCWKDRPYDRPTFSQLCIALERMCDARSSRNYVNTAIFEDFKFANIDVTEEEG